MAEQKYESHGFQDISPEDDNRRDKTQTDEPATRDPKHFNTHLKLMFDDVFAEPQPSVHSFDSVWATSSQVFEVTRTTCYKITSLVCSVPAAIIWGLYFACLTCYCVWCCRPCIRALEIKTQCVRSYCSLWADACIRPFTEACGAVFSSLRVTVLQRKVEQPGFVI